MHNKLMKLNFVICSFVLAELMMVRTLGKNLRPPVPKWSNSQ